MEEKNEYELVVSPGRRPIWKTIIAAFFFAIMIYYIYQLIRVYWILGFCEQTSKALPSFVALIGYNLSGGIAFSVMKCVLIDVDKDKLISRYFIGPFSKDILSAIPELEYVSVFMDSKEFYQVNLWYIGNKHYNMYIFEEKEPAMKFAQIVSEKLNIDLLDATEKGNSQWIDTTKI